VRCSLNSEKLQKERPLVNYQEHLKAAFYILTSLTDRKMHCLQRWIAAPNWSSPFDTAKSKRLADTGLWILERVEYRAWLSQTRSCSSNGPLYGKQFMVISGNFVPYMLDI
jgi:hypothetical protein